MEDGWLLEGTDGAGHPLRLLLSEADLRGAHLGLTLGRHPALAELVIDDRTVSARHCRIGLAEGRPVVEDLNSLNGTVLGEALVPPFQPVPLAEGDLLLLGHVRLRFRAQGED